MVPSRLKMGITYLEQMFSKLYFVQSEHLSQNNFQ
jgi:hypothetical protein